MPRPDALLTGEQTRRLLSTHVAKRYGTQRAAADAWGVSRPFVSQMLAGKRLIPDAIAAEIGVKRVRVTGYVKRDARRP